MSVLLQRARETGSIPPSFLREDNMKNDDGFETELFGVMAGSSGTYGRSATASLLVLLV